MQPQLGNSHQKIDRLLALQVRGEICIFDFGVNCPFKNKDISQQDLWKRCLSDDHCCFIKLVDKNVDFCLIWDWECVKDFLWVVWTRLTPISPLNPEPIHTPFSPRWRLTGGLSPFPCLTRRGDVWRPDSPPQAWNLPGPEWGPGSQRVKRDPGEFQWKFCIRGPIKIKCVRMRGK